MNTQTIGFLGSFDRIARSNPNAPSVIGAGMNPVVFGSALTDAGLKRMVKGAVDTLVDYGLAPADVMDLVPVKPFSEMEEQVLEFYRTRLPALFQKIKPSIS
jgi:hypothetical protein